MTDLRMLPTFSRAELHRAERLDVLATLACSPYCCLVDGFTDEPDAARTLLLDACSALGTLRSQNLDGDVISEVRSGGNGPQRGARTTNALLWHTDSVFDGPVPEIVALGVVRAAARGGLSRIVTVEDMTRELEQRDPEALVRLRRPFWFSRAEYVRPGSPPVISAPVFADAGVLYNRARIMRGHHIAGVPLTKEDRAALDALDAVLESESTPRIEMLIPAGTALLLRNRKLLHNRTAYDEEAHVPRLLYRVWLDPV